MQLPIASREHHETSRRFVLAGIAAVVVTYAGWQNLHLAETVRAVHGAAASSAAAHQVAREARSAAAHAALHGQVAATPPPPVWWSALPFAALLSCIAVLPLCHRTEHW